VSVRGGITTFLDLSVNEAVAPSAAADGPIPARVLVEEEDKEIGEILVWVTDGFLSGIEYAWFTNGMPAAFPPPERVRIESGEASETP
jgi:hypothetical protein